MEHLFVFALQVVPRVTSEEIAKLQEEREEVVKAQLEEIEAKRQAKLLRSS